MKVLPAHPPVAGGNPLSPPLGKFRLLPGGLLSLTLLLAACQDKGPAAAAASPPIVDVAAALSKEVTPWGEFNGRIGAIGSVAIRPRISGYIHSIAYREGEEISRGDLLFLIDPRPYRAALDSATARLDRARATALLAQAQDVRAQRSCRPAPRRSKKRKHVMPTMCKAPLT